MSATPQIAWLPDGRRLHLHHGPIDMIVAAEGPGRKAALARAAARFQTLLEELVAELPRLRAAQGPRLASETGRRMVRAVTPFAPLFLTPMAAVAGAGAETILAAIRDGPGIDKAFVNNGGDVAFHIGPGERMTAAVAAPGAPRIGIGPESGVRGVATSGRGGRSLSLGIADSVTVLAPSASLADAAATLVANAVDLPGHRAVERCPACEISPDSDLGTRLVTVGLGSLSGAEIAQALEAGAARAGAFCARGLIAGAALCLRGEMRFVGDLRMLRKKEPEHA